MNTTQLSLDVKGLCEQFEELKLRLSSIDVARITTRTEQPSHDDTARTTARMEQPRSELDRIRRVKRRRLQSKESRLEQEMEDERRLEREKHRSSARSSLRGNMQEKRKDESINIEKEDDHDSRRRDGRESRHRRNSTSSRDHDCN
ncbi:hypothetical protein COOONC_01988 [Cooperia oncophora]